MPNHIFPRELDDVVDLAALRHFYKSDPIAPKILDIFASRPNDSRITTVTSVEARLKGAAFVISRPQIFHVFRALQDFGCGTFIKEQFRRSAKREQSRFEWRVSLVAIGRAAADKKIR